MIPKLERRWDMPSSVVAAMKYFADAAKLRIIFVSGKVYDYLNVPENVYREMKTAGSKGTYLNTRIKGKYQYMEIK